MTKHIKLSKRFPNKAEACAFTEGLRKASDGSIHSIEMERSPAGFMFTWEVTWIDENKKAAELPEKHLPLTTQEYVREYKGTVCPVCRCNDIAGGSIGISDVQAFQSITCLNPNCEASWVDCYELSGYDNLEI